MVLDETGRLAEKHDRSKEDINKLANLNIRNVALVKERSKLKSAIDCKLKEAIQSGDNDVLNEVKNYGG